MSIIKEYLKLLPRGIKNIDKVFEGVMNQIKIELGTIPEEDLKIITIRRVICETCPYMSENAVKLGIYKNNGRKEKHCMHCGCPITTRTASLESNCGIEVYNELNSNNKLELKWSKIK